MSHMQTAANAFQPVVWVRGAGYHLSKIKPCKWMVNHDYQKYDKVNEERGREGERE